MKRFGALGVGLAFMWPLALPAHAAEVTRVASSLEEHDRFDLHFGVAYHYQFKSAAILREWNTGNPDDLDVQLAKDLVYRQHRHVLVPELEIGIWHDLAIYARLPVVVADLREYGFDRRSDDCVFGEDALSAGSATCVNKANSTTIRDQIIPTTGFDALALAPFGSLTGANTERIFRAPVRRGLDQLHIGLKYGVLNQAKRPHWPTWVIGLEGRFAVGRAMTFRREGTGTSFPAGNTRVGRRVHELGLWTAVSRRMGTFDPYFTAYWRQSIRAAGSVFESQPQSQTGFTVGTEIIAFENPSKHLKVAFDFEASGDLHYGGDAYSEIWELLADSPSLVGTNGTPDAGVCDRTAALAYAEIDPGDPGYLAAGGPGCQVYDGITTVQNYGSLGLRGGLNLTLGPRAVLQLRAQVATDTRHNLTGDPVPGEAGRRDVIDAAGRHYVIDDVLSVKAKARLLVTF